MPITPAYSWTQSSEQLVVTVTSVCITKASLDQFVGDEFIKINSPPCLLQLDQYDKIDPKSVRARIMSSGVEQTLMKDISGDWPDQTVGVRLGKEDRLKRRADCIARTVARLEDERQAKKAEKSLDKKLSQESNWEAEWAHKRETKKLESAAVEDVVSNLFVQEDVKQVEKAVPEKSVVVEEEAPEVVTTSIVVAIEDSDTRVKESTMTKSSVLVPTVAEPEMAVAAPRRRRQVVTARFTSRAPAVNHLPAREYVDKKALAVLRASQRGIQVPGHISTVTEASEKEMEALRLKMEADSLVQGASPDLTVAVEKYRVAVGLDGYNAATLSNMAAALQTSSIQSFSPFVCVSDLQDSSSPLDSVYHAENGCVHVRAQLIETVTVCGRALALVRSRLYLPPRTLMFVSKLHFRRALTQLRLGEWKLAQYDFNQIVKQQDALYKEAVLFDKQQEKEYQEALKQQSAADAPGNAAPVKPDPVLNETTEWLEEISNQTALVSEYANVPTGPLAQQCKRLIQEGCVEGLQSTRVLLALTPFSPISHILYAEALKLLHTLQGDRQAVLAYTWAQEVQHLRNLMQRNLALRKNVFTSLNLGSEGVDLLSLSEEEWSVHINAKIGGTASINSVLSVETDEFFDERGSNMDGMARAVAVRDGVEVTDDEDAKAAQQVLDDTQRGMDKNDTAGNQCIRVDTLLSLQSRDIHDDVVCTVDEVVTYDNSICDQYKQMFVMNGVDSEVSLDPAYIDLLPYKPQALPPLYPLEWPTKVVIFCLWESTLLQFERIALSESVRVDTDRVTQLHDYTEVNYATGVAALSKAIQEATRTMATAQRGLTVVESALTQTRKTTTVVGSYVATYLTTVKSVLDAIITLTESARGVAKLKTKQIQALLGRNALIAADTIAELIETVSKSGKAVFDAKTLLIEQRILSASSTHVLHYDDTCTVTTISANSSAVVDEVTLGILWLDRAVLRRRVPVARASDEDAPPALVANWEARNLAQRAITHIVPYVDPIISAIRLKQRACTVKINSSVPVNVILQTLLSAYLCAGVVDIQMVLSTQEQFPSQSRSLIENTIHNAQDMFDKAALLAVLLDQVTITLTDSGTPIPILSSTQVEKVVDDARKVRAWSEATLENK